MPGNCPQEIPDLEILKSKIRKRSESTESIHHSLNIPYRGLIARTRAWGGETQVHKGLMMSWLSKIPCWWLNSISLFKSYSLRKRLPVIYDTGERSWKQQAPIFPAQHIHYAHLSTQQWQDILYQDFSQVKIIFCFTLAVSTGVL